MDYYCTLVVGVNSTWSGTRNPTKLHL